MVRRCPGKTKRSAALISKKPHHTAIGICSMSEGAPIACPAGALRGPQDRCRGGLPGHTRARGRTQKGAAGPQDTGMSQDLKRGILKQVEPDVQTPVRDEASLGGLRDSAQ